MPSPSRAVSFGTTCWSDVRRAANLQGDVGCALEDLCGQYWYPLYAYLRRAGHAPEQAEDHVQSFFTDLLSRKSLRQADPARGRFRTFLLTACRNHVANRQRAERAERRGGGKPTLAFDAGDGEVRYASEPADHWTPERLFDRQWALSVIDAAFSQVRREYEAKGRADRFDSLRPLVAPTVDPPSQEEIAAKLGCTTGAVKVAAHRLRQRFGEAVREEIARTVDRHEAESMESTVEDELQLLLSALAGDR